MEAKQQLEAETSEKNNEYQPSAGKGFRGQEDFRRRVKWPTFRPCILSLSTSHIGNFETFLKRQYYRNRRGQACLVAKTFFALDNGIPGK
ncbi:hypothetical protein UPYG_G00193440 [Umbra pygmaea]|uniref:Uncharacterized protein n=1 Tax=Umbra pygmaea TaxID=75934 RepID=A0ABD0WGL0_UMBPY